MIVWHSWLEDYCRWRNCVQLSSKRSEVWISENHTFFLHMIWCFYWNPIQETFQTSSFTVDRFPEWGWYVRVFSASIYIEEMFFRCLNYRITLSGFIQYAIMNILLFKINIPTELNSEIRYKMSNVGDDYLILDAFHIIQPALVVWIIYHGGEKRNFQTSEYNHKIVKDCASLGLQVKPAMPALVLNIRNPWYIWTLTIISHDRK